MTGSYPLSTESLRAAVRARVEETNLRDTAREIGWTHSALSRFIAGTTKQPHRRTMMRIMEWYKQQSSGKPRVEPAEVEMAKSILGVWGAELPRNVRERELENAFEDIRRRAK